MLSSSKLLLIGFMLISNLSQADQNQEAQLKAIFEADLKAAKTGDAKSEYYVCLEYLNGWGVNKNSDRAFAFCNRSANSGSTEARVLLAELYIKGIGVEKDESAALRWLKLAAKDGSLAAHSALASVYFNIEETGAFTNYELGKKHALVSAKGGYSFGQLHMGLMYYYGLEPDADVESDINWKQAIYWLEKSANQGNSFATDHLVNIYYKVAGQKNAQKAFFWLLIHDKFGTSEIERSTYYDVESKLSSGQRNRIKNEAKRLEQQILAKRLPPE